MNDRYHKSVNGSNNAAAKVTLYKTQTLCIIFLIDGEF